MPWYFAVQPSAEDPSRTFADADQIAARMHAAARALDVRLIPVRPRTAAGFVFAVATRRAVARDEVTSRLRKEPALKKYQISTEAKSPDGPFSW